MKRILGLFRLDRQLAGDEERRAVDVQRLVDRDRAARRQRNALRPDSLVLLRQLHLAEEDVGAVHPAQLVGAFRILLHPVADALHRHLLARNDAALDQDATDRRVGMAVVGIVVDAHRRAVIETDPRGALDLREQQIRLIPQPRDLEATALDGAVLDLRAVVVGHELAPSDLAIDRTLVGQARRVLLETAHEQVGRTAIDRNVVDLVLGARALDHRLVVAGDEAVGIAELGDLQRLEISLEERARRGAVGRLGRPCLTARVAQRVAERLVLRGAIGLGRDRLAAGAEGSVRRELVIVGPAGHLAPGQRPILAVADFQRPVELRVGQVAHRRSGRVTPGSHRLSRVRRKHDSRDAQGERWRPISEAPGSKNPLPNLANHACTIKVPLNANSEKQG
ncbi:hypothetical protein BRAO375_600055 [Bradyrhizobium sp. ORS 375]|nr:hypothetical protein BRAO375_600055 [Bradyrhizobium sp. ORS 375]